MLHMSVGQVLLIEGICSSPESIFEPCTPATDGLSSPRGVASLIPQLLIGLDPILLTVLNVHAPEAEAIHDFSQAVVIIEKLDRSLDVEENLGAFSHPQRMDRAWVFGDVVTRLGLPGISA